MTYLNQTRCEESSSEEASMEVNPEELKALLGGRTAENKEAFEDYASTIDAEYDDCSLPESNACVLEDDEGSIGVVDEDADIPQNAKLSHQDRSIIREILCDMEKPQSEIKPQETNNIEHREPEKFNGFVYGITRKLLNRHVWRCCEGRLYYYDAVKGCYGQISEHRLKTIIRNGWDEDVIKKLSRNAVMEITDRLITDPSIQVNEEYFNNYQHLMNFRNCTLDLSTDRILKHSPEYGFSSCINADYQSDAPVGRNFLSFIYQCTEGNEDKERHLQEIFGYLLSEYYAAKKVPFIIGQPNSGKSVLLNLVTVLVGEEHCAHVPLEDLHKRFVLADLFNKKLNICGELGTQGLGSIAAFKAISGNDTIAAEPKGGKRINYQSKIKLLFAGNSMPPLQSAEITNAFFERLTFVLFNRTIPEEERDHDLLQKLIKYEAPYICQWAIEGVKRLMSKGFVFSESEESVNFKANYCAEQNTVADFVKNCCALQGEVHSKMLYQEYTRHCSDNCMTILGRREFFAEISKLRVKKERFRINCSKPYWGYKGIRLVGGHITRVGGNMEHLEQCARKL